MATLSPAPPGGLKFGGPVPTGVKVLGGTYAVVGDDVTFAHEDAVPGATPELTRCSRRRACATAWWFPSVRKGEVHERRPRGDRPAQTPRARGRRDMTPPEAKPRQRGALGG